MSETKPQVREPGPSTYTTDLPPPPANPQVVVPLLPTLPDPTALWTNHHHQSSSGSNSSSLFLLQEARASMSQFRELRKQIMRGQAQAQGQFVHYPGSVLPPLPPVPVPVPGHGHGPNSHASSLASGSGSGSVPGLGLEPEERPSLPTFLEITREGKGKGKAGEVEGYLKALKAHYPTWEAEERYGGRAVLCYSYPQNEQHRGKGKGKGKDREGTAVWVILKPISSEKETESERKVGKVKVFHNIRGQPPDITSSSWHTGQSNHLTSLELTLPELLYRIPHLPSLAKEPCYYCSKHLKFPDGRPDYSGFLPPPKVVRRGSKRKLSMSITAGEESAMSDGEVMGGDGGRWVCWHGSCRE